MEPPHQQTDPSGQPVAPNFAAMEPTYRTGHFPGGVSGLQGSVTITNGEHPIADNQLFLSLWAEGLDGQTQNSAAASEWLAAFQAFETRTVQLVAQADPGRWNVAMAIQDPSGQSLRDFAAQVATVEGAVHHAQAFHDGKFIYTFEVTHITAHGAVITVNYRLHNTGQAAIPAGFPISIALAEPDGTGSTQVYAIEVAVAPGGVGDKHLTVEGFNTHNAGDTSQLWLTGDEGGVSEHTNEFTVHWQSADSATATPV